MSLPVSVPPALAMHAFKVLVLVSLSGNCAYATIATGIDEEAQLPYWELVEPEMSLRLVQRLPDQTRGFFQARGFSAENAEIVAQSCVFQTIFKNTSTVSGGSPVEYDLRDWVVHRSGGRRHMKTREDWREVWTKRRVDKGARIAFEWALFPTRQTYQPGDYNWGMSVFGIDPGDEFDLDVVWKRQGEIRNARITGMRCAPDAVEPDSR